MPTPRKPQPKAVKTKTSKSTSKSPRKWADIENNELRVTNGKVRPPITENDASRKYPSPSEDYIFKSRWNEFIQNVSVRDNFNRGHLEQLSLLCDLYVDYESLSASIAITGFSYESHGQSGTQVKPYPEVAIRTRTLAEIRNYSKTLGLVLVKDNSSREAEKDEDAWD